MKSILTIIILSLSLPIILWAQAEVDEDQGVYEYVLTKIKIPADEALQKLNKAFPAQNIKIVSTYESSSPGNCAYKAHVMILYDSLYTQKMLAFNGKTAPFALVDRLNLFADEAGLHISLVNPLNILRTVLMDDEKYLDFASAHLQKLRSVIEKAVPGTVSHKQYGEIRDEGYIGRTMGVMAGGSFDEKIESLAASKTLTFTQALAKLQKAFARPAGEWKIRAGFELILPDKKMAVFGVSSPSIEAKSFDIVQEGSDDSREDFKCPGIAHAGAYPFEVVLRQQGNGVKVVMVESMYRMKMFFEDAGMMAFAANMTMPGSIQSDVESVVQTALK